METTNTNIESQTQFLELKISYEMLLTLVESEPFHEFNHNIIVENSGDIKIRIYYTNNNELTNLINFIASIKNSLAQ